MNSIKARNSVPPQNNLQSPAEDSKFQKSFFANEENVHKLNRLKELRLSLNKLKNQ